MSDSDPPRPTSRQTPGDDATVVYRGALFSVVEWSVAGPNGTKRKFEQLRRPDTALVLPVRDGSVILGSEQQPGTSRMLRSIGGRVDPGESPSRAARRELKEELNLEAAAMLHWVSWQPVNKIDWAVSIFVATGLTAAAGTSATDWSEDIAPVDVPLSDLLAGAVELDDNELQYQLMRAGWDAEHRAHLLQAAAS